MTEKSINSHEKDSNYDEKIRNRNCKIAKVALVLASLGVVGGGAKLTTALVRANNEAQAQRQYEEMRSDPTYMITNAYNNGPGEDVIEYDLPAGNVSENAVARVKAVIPDLKVNPEYQKIADALEGQNGLDSANKGYKVKSWPEDINQDGTPDVVLTKSAEK